MWQKIKCWLGFHSYFRVCHSNNMCVGYDYMKNKEKCQKCKFGEIICKHCGMKKK